MNKFKTKIILKIKYCNEFKIFIQWNVHVVEFDNIKFRSAES